MDDNQLANAVNAAFRLFNSDDFNVPVRDLESLAVFKNLLRAILEGQLVLATPDRLKPERENTPDGNKDGD